MTVNTPLSPSQLTANVSQDWINEALVDEQAMQASFIGQERAREALMFGLGINARGYNLYVMGEASTGRFTLVKEYIEREMKTLSTPDDWCYINNFDDEREPVSLRLSPGGAKRLQRSISGLIDDVLNTFPAAFDNPGYQRQKRAITRQFEERYEAAIALVERFAQANEVALYDEDGTISFSPLIDGKPVDDAQFALLDEEARERFYALIAELENRLSESLLGLPAWRRENSEKLRELDRSTVEQGIKPLLKELEHQYADNFAIVKFLRQLRTFLIDTIVGFYDQEKTEDRVDKREQREFLIQQVLPNPLVEHRLDDGAPVVYEPNPTYSNLFGKIEYLSQQGSVFTNYRMLRAGALHKANGGYLLLDVEHLIDQPYVWETLKLAIKSGQLRMSLPQDEMGMVNAVTLSPAPIDIKVKVVLFGSRSLYYSLQDFDPEFDELFRVLVDFDSDIELTKQSLSDFVGRVRHHVFECGLEAISAEAMARLVEYSLRMAEHQHKLSAHFADVIELIHEAQYFCRQSHGRVVELEHVTAALVAKKRRTGRVSMSLLNDIKEGHVLIDTEGSAVGKVNGLTVLEVGDTAFGTPARITSTVFCGASGVVDIEREVELGQSIHSKGVMLLTGYLGNKYAQHFPLTLSANIALEQSYGHIDGDSASLGELIALISALTNIPALQTLAVTGSINQYGEVQAVGGVNEKIEGFFELCQYRGFTGTQGVVIPKSNEVNLVLSDAVVNAVEKGQFHIYSVSTVDEALSLLMQREAGSLNSRERYPKKSINYEALNRLYNISLTVNGGE